MHAVRSGEISPDEFLQASLNDDTRYFMDLNRKQCIDTLSLSIIEYNA